MSKDNHKSKIWKEERKLVKQRQLEFLQEDFNEAQDEYNRTRAKLNQLKKNYHENKMKLENTLERDDARMSHLGVEINTLTRKISKID